MKFIPSLLLLLIPALANGQTIPDWSVSVDSVAAQQITFSTGAGAGGAVSIKVAMTDKCRMEADAATRVTVGQMYPSNAVSGIAVTSSVADPNAGPTVSNTVGFSFVEGINANSNIYTDDGDQTATVEFCVMMGLYGGADLIDFAEVKMTYSIDLVTNIPELTGYTVTQAEQFQDEGEQALAFDGTVLAFFCDPTTKAILTDNGAKTHQGSIMHVCFKVDGGQFEVSDILDFTVKNALAATPTQDIITGGTVGALYATRECTDASNTDENICMVSFLLKADFYDFATLTLEGSGNVLLELGASPGRRQLRQKVQIVDAHRQLSEPVEEQFQVAPQNFEVDQVNGAGSSACSAMTSLAAIGAVAGAALAL